MLIETDINEMVRANWRGPGKENRPMPKRAVLSDQDLSFDDDVVARGTVIDSVLTRDGTLFELVEGDGAMLVKVAGRTLMSSLIHDSEEELAELALQHLPQARQVLVGGLGLGFTLRAVLDRVDADCSVTVAELVPALVKWNRERLGELNDHPLLDPRCEVIEGDVRTLIRGSTSRFDAIILDVDNGPVALCSEGNGHLYNAAGVRACRKALRPHGVLAVWSSSPSPRYVRHLKNADFDVDAVRVAACAGSPVHHVLFIAERLPSRKHGFD